MSEACEREARSLALEKAYVHQVYQQISNASDSLPDRGRAWPRVKQFLSDLEPGSLVCDVGESIKFFLNKTEIFNVSRKKKLRNHSGERKRPTVNPIILFSFIISN